MLHIGANQVNALLDWPSLIEAMRAAHGQTARPDIGDMLLGRGGRTLLVRAAFADGLGIGLKAVTVFAGNPARQPPKPTVQGQFLLFSEDDGSVLASIDGAAMTPWKTAADSALGASFLARPDVRVMAMIGAGVMARPLIEAHLTVRPSIGEILLWNRTRAGAERLAGMIGGLGRGVRVVERLEDAVRAADLLSSATMAVEPLIQGAWLKPGVHVDLVGAYRPDMREADGEVLRRGRLFVDARETVLEHIGELLIPLRAGVIRAADVEGDLFDLCGGQSVTREPADITVFKNGGGAHLDLMTARHIYGRATA